MATYKRGVNLGSILFNPKYTTNAKEYQTKQRHRRKPIKRQAKEVIRGVEWFYYLVSNDVCQGLIDYIGKDKISKKLLVCMNIPVSLDKNKKIVRLFSAFDSPITFLKYIKGVPLEKWNFFEEILGHQHQKLYFDIDIDSDTAPSSVDLNSFSSTLLEKLIDNIDKKFFEKGYDFDLCKNILLFSSNSDKKKSYHIIVDGYKVENNKQNELLANEILEDMPIPYKRCIDSSMYSAKQQLRFLGSQKPGSGRPKIFISKWYHKGKVIQYDCPTDKTLLFTTIFRKSCVTITDDCELIKIDTIEEDGHNLRQSDTDYDEIEITNDAIIAIYNRTNNVLFDIFKPYEIKGSLILLKRKKPAKCLLCERVHDNENSYLRVDKNGQVWFYCRRNDTKNKHVADISDIVDCVSDKHQELLTHTLIDSTKIHHVVYAPGSLNNIKTSNINTQHSVTKQRPHIVNNNPPDLDTVHSKLRNLAISSNIVFKSRKY